MRRITVRVSVKKTSLAIAIGMFTYLITLPMRFITKEYHNKLISGIVGKVLRIEVIR